MLRNFALFLAAIALFAFSLPTASANTDNRHWIFASGEKLTAILDSYDAEKDVVTLRTGDDGKKREYKLKDFSEVDRAWLKEWAEIAEELEVIMKNSKGRFEHFQAQGRYTTDFYVYFPGSYTNGAKLPMVIMFHPTGKDARYNKQHIEAAEAVGVILVTVDTFRNTNDEKFSAELLERFKDLLPKIEDTVPHDPAKMFLGGTSGGAMTAYEYSAQVKRPWAGILANGGWLGGEKKYYDMPHPSGMRIAMVNGNNDKAANAWVDNDKKVLTDKGCEVKVFSFQGAHQEAPPLTQIKVLLWLLEQPEK